MGFPALRGFEATRPSGTAAALERGCAWLTWLQMGKAEVAGAGGLGCRRGAESPEVWETDERLWRLLSLLQVG